MLRLLSPAIRRFVEEDTTGCGALTATLLAYAAAILNAKVATQRLYIHVNTAHHRLARIEEKTGASPDSEDVSAIATPYGPVRWRPTASISG